MSTTTPNLNLVLPEGSENVSRSIINTNNQAIDSAFGDLQDDVGKCAQFIILTTSDDTWAKIWTKINKLSSGDTATFTAESSQFGIISSNARSNKVYGTISRRTGSEFEFLLRANSNATTVIISKIENASSSSPGSYSETGNFMSIYTDNTGSGTAVTSLETIPLGSWGRTYFAASVSPSGSAAGYNTLCFGQNDNYKTIIAITGTAAFYNTKHNGTWYGWKKFTITNA